MPKSKYLFAKLIKCVQCGNNYRGLKGRSKKRYICNGYSMKKPNACKIRYGIDENILTQIVETFCNRNGIEVKLTNDFMKSIIDKILVDREEDKLKVFYKNGEEAVYSNKQFRV